MKTIKVKLYTNRITADLTSLLTYVYSYNLKHGITLNFDIQAISINGYVSTYQQVRPNTWLWILTGAEKYVPLDATHDVTVFMFDQNEWKAAPGGQYPLLPSTPTSDCILLSNNKPFINLGYYQPLASDTNIMFVHELMHAYTKLATAGGLPTVDQMDTYDQNANPDSLTGNFAIQWKNLQPWLNPPLPKNMNAILKRTKDNGVETLGTLTVTKPDGSNFICSTLERPWLNNQHNISCVPTGTYQCSVQPFYKTHMYELANVPNRTGIFIHVANYVTDLEGCIGLGVNPADINHDGQIDITSSTATIAAFMAFTGNQPFTLVIE